MADRLRRLSRSTLFTVGAILVLYIGAHPRVYGQFNSVASDVLQSLQSERLNREDRENLERGYYEDLLNVERTNVELWNVYEKRPPEWRSLWQTEAVRFTGDELRLVMVPGMQIQLKGKRFSINPWGMRDREYGKQKPPHTVRIALLGSSAVMGSGVADDETFEWLVEDLLNGDGNQPVRYELLSFAVSSYTAVQQVKLVIDKVIDFQPDAILYVAHETEIEKTVADLGILIETGVDLPYPALDSIAARSGAAAGTPRSIVRRRLKPFEDQIVEWAYRTIVSHCREHGVEPVWVFLPMPASGIRGKPSAVDRVDPRVDHLFQLAEGAGFSVLDLSGVYDGHELPDLWVAEWDRHPNAIAHQLIARRLYDGLMTSGALTSSERQTVSSVSTPQGRLATRAPNP